MTTEEKIDNTQDLHEGLVQDSVLENVEEVTDIDIVTMIDPDSGDIFVKLPAKLVKILNWSSDTQLVWVVDDKNGYILGKKSD